MDHLEFEFLGGTIGEGRIKLRFLIQGQRQDILELLRIRAVDYDHNLSFRAVRIGIIEFQGGHFGAGNAVCTKTIGKMTPFPRKS